MVADGSFLLAIGGTMSLSCAFITCAFPVKRKRDETPFRKVISKSEEVEDEGIKSPHCSATVVRKQEPNQLPPKSSESKKTKSHESKRSKSSIAAHEQELESNSDWNPSIMSSILSSTQDFQDSEPHKSVSRCISNPVVTPCTDEYPTDDMDSWTPPELFDNYTRGSEEQWAREDSDGLFRRVVSDPVVTPRTDEYPTLSNTEKESTKNALMVKEQMIASKMVGDTPTQQDLKGLKSKEKGGSSKKERQVGEIPDLKKHSEHVDTKKKAEEPDDLSRISENTIAALDELYPDTLGKKGGSSKKEKQVGEIPDLKKHSEHVDTKKKAEEPDDLSRISENTIAALDELYPDTLGKKIQTTESH